MKKLAITVSCLVLVCTASATAFARGGYYHHYSPPHYYSHHHGWHHSGGDIAAGVFFGLLTGAIIAQAFAPPPAPVYPSQYSYGPPVVVEQPRVCVEERVVSGEWQQNPYDGTRFWAAFPYPMKRRFQVPCY